MASQDVEIEIKLPLLNEEKVVEFLEAKSKPKAKGIVQRDTYFNHPSRDFLSPKHPSEWLRVREAKNGASITFKHYKPEGAAVHDYADEFETHVESAEQIKKILLNLGFRELAVVDKSRDTWEFKDTEIAIDKVEGLGRFIEVEALKHFDDPKECRKYLYSVLKELGAECGPEEVYGYPYMILKKNGYAFGGKA